VEEKKGSKEVDEGEFRRNSKLVRPLWYYRSRNFFERLKDESSPD
jgi:hypothetical protein